MTDYYPLLQRVVASQKTPQARAAAYARARAALSEQLRGWPYDKAVTERMALENAIELVEQSINFDRYEGTWTLPPVGRSPPLAARLPTPEASRTPRAWLEARPYAERTDLDGPVERSDAGPAKFDRGADTSTLPPVVRSSALGARLPSPQASGTPRAWRWLIIPLLLVLPVLTLFVFAIAVMVQASRSASNFDTFVLNAATRHGVLLYIAFALACFILGAYTGVRVGKRKLQDFATLLVSQLCGLCLFFAFAALSGQFPKTLWLATLFVAICAFIVQNVLIWTARLPNVEKFLDEANIAQALVIAEAASLMVIFGLFFFANSILQMGLLIYCGFLFDPARLGQPDYQARLALFTLVLPAALNSVSLLFLQIRMLLSEYTTPRIRNLYLAGAVGNVAVSSIMVVGPLYAYHDGFPRIATLIPPLHTLGIVMAAAFAVLLITPYYFGYLNNRRLAINLKAAFEKFVARAEKLARRREGGNRRHEENKLLHNIVTAYASLTENPLLYFFMLKLLERFVQDATSREIEHRRLAMLKSLGYGKEGEFQGDPIAEINQISVHVKHDFHFRLNPLALSYFAKVEDNLDAVAEVHPLLFNAAKLTELLGTLVDEDPDRADKLDDLKDEMLKDVQVGAKGNWIPGSVLSILTAALIHPISSTIVARIEPFAKGLANGLFDWFTKTVISLAA
jgi:hypothetical protein